MKIEFDVSLISSYPRANSPASLRPIMRFALERAHFVCDRATCIESEKLQSEGVTRIAFLYTTCEPEINSTWAEPFEKSLKVKLVLNFVVDIESHFFDA